MDKFNEPQYFEVGMKYKRSMDGRIFECVWSGVRNAILNSGGKEDYFISQLRRANYTVYTEPQTITRYVCVYNTPDGLHFGSLCMTREAAQETAAHYCNVIYPGTWFVLDIIPVTYTTPSE